MRPGPSCSLARGLSLTYLLSHNFLIFLSFLCITHYIIIRPLAAMRLPRAIKSSMCSSTDVEATKRSSR